MSAPTAYPPPSRREILSWAMFDFANSSYTTIIVTVAFGVYFTRLVAPPGRGDALWGQGIAVANLIVLLLSPIVGAIADDSGRKKLFLFFFQVVSQQVFKRLDFSLPLCLGNIKSV